MPGMEYLEALILGVVQGVAEFLPISSSGHIVIFSELLHRATGREVDPHSDLQMNVALHLGTLGSIVAVYYADIWALLRQRRRCLLIVLATVPVVIVGFGLKHWIETRLQTPLVAGIGLLVTALLLVAGQKLQKNVFTLDELPLAGALTIGLSQAIAIVPGISRSGSTIAGGLLVGLKRDSAATFSFLIAVPAILGAAILTAVDIAKGHGGNNSIDALCFGALVAFGVGFIALSLLLRIISRQRLHWFAWYCAVAGTATILWQLAE